jgi:predicted nuclease of restriction endonuclease-like (RecB) superfamily
MRLSDKNAQKYYLIEAAANNWTVRTLGRNISTLYYQRLLSSQKKDIGQLDWQAGVSPPI